MNHIIIGGYTPLKKVFVWKQRQRNYLKRKPNILRVASQCVDRIYGTPENAEHMTRNDQPLMEVAGNTILKIS